MSRSTEFFKTHLIIQTILFNINFIQYNFNKSRLHLECETRCYVMLLVGTHPLHNVI